MNTETKRFVRADACDDLEDAAEALFRAANLLAASGDSELSVRIAAMAYEASTVKIRVQKVNDA